MKGLRLSRAAAALTLATVAAGPAAAEILTIQMRRDTDGVRKFKLKAGPGRVSTPDGNLIFIWGYRDEMVVAGSANVQYPGPTLEVREGEVVTVDLTSDLDVPTSLVFPGQRDVKVLNMPGGLPNVQGLLSRWEVVRGGKVRYQFRALQAGTYLYHSGTDPDLQVEMGLFGALIVRPADYSRVNPELRRAYHHDDTRYDREYIFIHSEMDPRIHRKIQLGRAAEVDTAELFPVYWFLNGRCAPDTFLPADVSWLPSQPYNALVQMHPGEKILARVVSAGRDEHPFHPHGNHVRVIARDGRLLSSDPADPGVGADLSHKIFTVNALPGQTVDAIFEWTGEKLGWDIYGHREADPLEPSEYAPDHGKPFPTLLPETLDVTLGGFWSGSPFLGALEGLPPGEGGLNPNGAFTFLWHSHSEKELANNDIFPGGMIAILFVEHPSVDLGVD